MLKDSSCKHGDICVYDDFTTFIAQIVFWARKVKTIDYIGDIELIGLLYKIASFKHLNFHFINPKHTYDAHCYMKSDVLFIDKNLDNAHLIASNLPIEKKAVFIDSKVKLLSNIESSNCKTHVKDTYIN